MTSEKSWSWPEGALSGGEVPGRVWRGVGVLQVDPVQTGTTTLAGLQSGLLGESGRRLRLEYKWVLDKLEGGAIGIS